MVTNAPSRATGATRPSGSRVPADGSRLHAIDGLRFLAAVGVVIYHYTAMWSTVWGEDPGDRFGAFGEFVMYFSLAPELFFVVSGFVILWTAWGRTVPQVAASRLARVYPAYWAALLLTSVLLIVLWPAGKRVSVGEALVNVTLLQEAFGVRHVDGVYWTLWTELRFYLLITIFVALGITRRRIIVFATLWPLAAMGVETVGWGLASTVLISRYAPFFAGGMLLYLIYRQGHSRLLWLLVAGNTALAVWSNVGVKTAELSNATAYTPDPVVLGVIVVACFAGVAATALTPLRRLPWPFLATLGALTYPLYLIHQFWGWWTISLVQEHLPTAVTVGVAFAVAMALAAAIHYGVEERVNRPARRALERLLSRAGAVLPGTARGSGEPAPGPAVTGLPDDARARR